MEDIMIEEHEIKAKKRKKGGFWKGFFCATILFMVITAICLTAGLFLRTRVIFSNTSGLVTQDSGVQAK